MKRLVLVVSCFVAIHCSFAQSATTDFKADSDSVFIAVEQMPEFPGGIPGLWQFLSQNLKYPPEARKDNVQGKVFVSFVVGSDGTVRDVFVAKGIGAGCDEEAVRVVKLMPQWKPGIQFGKAVPVRYSLPFAFTLTVQDSKSKK